ncbi:MAG: 16S rRNA (cytosine(967)-C(5))-methyltransferase [Betaproteobacteria bacterium RBG_16_64_18]|nr:MAG: 16S rRNA (cytosine(967)-C(5))-methyltransferase [Betaproteobacteria bacterium RBG_16_64_18]OGA39319.1 MAG: 16S rRNA (cytosine(967)-C(5))-methyltransferase [Betaproteobacteria bacterium RIFCSPLOWO2_12_FULL_65_110]
MSAVLNPSPALAESLAAAARAVDGVLSGASLNAGLETIRPRILRAAAQDLSFNALRGFGLVDAALERLLERPLMDQVVRALLLAALAELFNRPQSAHAVVHQAVEATSLLGQPRARGLVNAVLRNFLRQGTQLRDEIEKTDSGRFRHPQWWIDRVRIAYPAHWEEVLRAANAHPPMTLRVNMRRASVEGYLEKLAQADMRARAIGGTAVLLERPCRVDALPGFAEGEVSVQDKGAQAAAPLLNVEPGMRVLDACAAPGGKAAHLLELVECELLAVDISRERALRIDENFSRLGLKGTVLVGDAARPPTFWDGRPFDRVLADVPCSASGVVRRHPDILWLRRETDIAGFAAAQARLLEALWQLLIPGGTLLYATCSVFPEENGLQVRSFLGRHPEALAMPLAGVENGQILPGSDTDGFYYALLQKNRS